MKNRKTLVTAILIFLIVLSLIGAILVGGRVHTESIGEAIHDAVLHEENKISLFGVLEVNPSLISAFSVTGILLIFAAAVRIFVIPRFKRIPGKFQMLLEKLVSFFDDLAKTNSPHRNSFLGVYIFAAGIYIFVSTVFELFGAQAITTLGTPIALPAPLSDINAAIAMGCQSYLVILTGGIASNKLKGVGLTLKEFSLPISMSFRLFGALLSGLLVTELVYYTIYLSFILPVVVAVLFTLIHAIIQTYVLTLLTSIFYGEVSHPHEKKPKKAKKPKKSRSNAPAAV